MPDQIPEIFLTAAVKRMQLSEDDIDRCLDKLSDEQMWHRGADHENSVANLLLHLEGNLRQWFLHGIDGQPDVRRRDAEFTLSPSQRCAEVRRCFAATLAECRKVIGSLRPERLLEMVDPPPADGQPGWRPARRHRSGSIPPTQTIGCRMRDAAGSAMRGGHNGPQHRPLYPSISTTTFPIVLPD